MTMRPKLGVPIREPHFLCFYGPESVGVTPEELRNELSPYYFDLPYDWYDVRREHVRQILSFMKSHPKLGPFYLNYTVPLQQYFTGHKPFSGLPRDLLAYIYGDRSLINSLEGYGPYRKRAMEKTLYSLTPEGEFILVDRGKGSITESNLTEDSHVFERQYVRIPRGLGDNLTFQKIIQFALQKISGLRPNAKYFQLDVHLMRLVVRPGREVTNTPEGFHQDDSDFIQTLMVHRGFINGATTHVALKGASGSALFAEHTLLPGQCVLMQDKTEEGGYYHRVTKASVAPRVTENQHRDILGLDIKVVEQDHRL